MVDGQGIPARTASTRELFSRNSLRCTKQRMAVYETLRACKCHPTAEELFQLVKPRTGRLSLATVYNTLEALCRAGLVQRMPMPTGCCRYDADTEPHLHVAFRHPPHIMDVPIDLSRQLIAELPQAVLRRIEHTLGVVIDGVNVQIVARRGGAR
jgi:Fe2+ or Zn2+ uptake regulation protein